MLHLQPRYQMLRRQQEWKAAFRLSPLTDICWRKAVCSCVSSLRPLPCKILQGLVLSLFLSIMCRRAVGKVRRSPGLWYHQSVDGNQLACSADAISAMTQMSQDLQEISPKITISWLELNKEERDGAGRKEETLLQLRQWGNPAFTSGKCYVIWGPGVNHWVAPGFSLACKVLMSFPVCSAVIFLW